MPKLACIDSATIQASIKWKETELNMNISDNNWIESTKNRKYNYSMPYEMKSLATLCTIPWIENFVFHFDAQENLSYDADNCHQAMLIYLSIFPQKWKIRGKCTQKTIFHFIQFNSIQFPQKRQIRWKLMSKTI